MTPAGEGALATPRGSQLDAMRRFVAASPRGARPSRVADAGPRIVAVGSGKGGTGTSTVAALLAASMAAAGHAVLLVDAGERLGALHLLLGVEPAPPSGDARDPEELLIPVAASLTLLPGALATLDASRSATERRLLFRRATALYGRYDLVVIDAGATLDTMLAVCGEGVGRFLAVTAIDRIAATATYALVKALLARHPTLAIEVLANRLDAASAEAGVASIAAAAAHFLDHPLPYAGAVPDDPDFASALAAGMGAHEAANGSAAASALQRIGERLMAEHLTAGRPAASSAAPPQSRLSLKG